MPERTYSAPVIACFGSTIGQHIRHVLDHYSCFLEGVSAGGIDYDARSRAELIERDPREASCLIEALVAQLLTLSAGMEAQVRVRLEAGTGGDWCSSTLGRELQFLLGHTVHHYALISTCCRLLGITVPAEFGIAPSTLRARTALSAAQ